MPIASEARMLGSVPAIVAISGSLRHASYNTMLLRAAIELAPSGTTLEMASIKEVPLYDGDVEAAGLPAAVLALKERVAASDGLLLVTPEYNNGVPGVLKNAIDWLSRPAGDIARIFAGLPVGVIGATPGAGATGLAQAAWLPVLRTLGTLHYSGARVGIARAASVFDGEGKLVDDAVRAQLTRYLSGFAEFVARHGRARASGGKP
jgi:NAD(P)H-dependent FMN reductase